MGFLQFEQKQAFFIEIHLFIQFTSMHPFIQKILKWYFFNLKKLAFFIEIYLFIQFTGMHPITDL